MDKPLIGQEKLEAVVYDERRIIVTGTFWDETEEERSKESLCESRKTGRGGREERGMTVRIVSHEHVGR